MKRILNKSKQILVLLTGFIILVIIMLKGSCSRLQTLPWTKQMEQFRWEQHQLLHAFVTPADADNKNVIWSSDDEAVATVSNGVVTGVSLGSATITATSAADGTIKATCSFIVTPSTGQVINVSGDITENTTWYAAAKYMLVRLCLCEKQCNSYY